MKMISELSRSHSLTFSKKQERFPYWVKVVILFCLGWTVIYINRTVLNPVMGDIQREFHLNNAQLGLINSVFFLSYTFMQVPSGLLADKFSRKMILIPGFLLCAIGQFGAGLMTTFTGFLVFRLISGIGQGCYYGPQYGLSSQTIPSEKRGLSNAIINSGSALGMAIGLIGASFLAYELNLGWRVPFYISAILTVLLTIAFALIIKGRAKTLASQEMSTNPSANVEQKPMSEVLFSKKMIITYMVNFASNYGFFMILTWLPFYLETERGIPTSQTGFFSSLVAFAAVPGALIFSRVSDKFGRRKPIVLLLLPLAALTLALIVYVKSWTLVVIMIILYGFIGKLALDPIMISFVADGAPKHGFSTLFSVFNSSGMVASILAPTITGFMADLTGSMAASFYLASFFLIFGFVTFLFIKEKSYKL